jgi:hypothetical protein
MKRVCITCPGKKFDCLFLFLLLLTLITTLTLHSVEPVIVVHNTLAEIESVKGKIQLKLVRTWGGDEVEDENQFFKNPWDIIIGKDNFIYISDFGNHRIQVFDDKGNYKRSIGRRGQGPGDLLNPTRLAMDIHGNIIVAELGNSRIQVLAPDGKYITDFRVLDGWISGLQAVSKGDAIVLNIPKKTLSSRKLLFIYDYKGKPVRAIGQYAHKVKGFGESEGVLFAINRFDSFYTVFSASPYLLKYSYTGELLMFMTYEMPYETPIATWDNVKGIININGKAIDRASYELSVDYPGRIFIISQKRRKTKNELNASGLSTLKRRDGEVLIYRGKVETEKADFLRLLVFNSMGKVIAATDIEVFCDYLYIHGDRLFIIDSFKAMKIYEYKISFRK